MRTLAQADPLAAPERPVTEEYAIQYYSRMDDLFDRTISKSEKVFETNKNINLIVVGVGVTLIAYSIVYGAINGLDLFSTAFGTLGAAEFIAVFWFSPQRKIQELIANLVKSRYSIGTTGKMWRLS